MNRDTLQFIDTHCHIHDAAFSEKFGGKHATDMAQEANVLGVNQFVCVGTDVVSSRQAVAFCRNEPNCFASLALHPHEAADNTAENLKAAMEEIGALVNDPNVVAIGECGLDYFYHSQKSVQERQKKLLELHIELALESGLPMIFHVRDAFLDFFAILDHVNGSLSHDRHIQGVVHSFSATTVELEGVLKRGLYVGLNGIMTFTKDRKQLEAAKVVPLERLVLETDAPFLTPAPFRGKICEPKHVVRVAEFLSDLRGESLEQIAKTTTLNARRLFNL